MFACGQQAVLLRNRHVRQSLRKSCMSGILVRRTGVSSRVKRVLTRDSLSTPPVARSLRVVLFQNAALRCP